MAKHSGKKSLADLNAAQFISTIQPSRELTLQESEVFNNVIGAWPENHWITSDAELLTQYSRLCVLFDVLIAAGEVGDLDKTARMILSYATKLRITPQSRYDEKAVARRAEHGRENEAAKDRLLGKGVWANAVAN